MLRAVDLNKVSLIKSSSDLDKSDDISVYPQLKEDCFKFYCTNNSLSRHTLSYVCCNSRAPCYCGATCSVVINRDSSTHSIKPTFKFNYQHSDLCIEKINNSLNDEQKSLIEEKAIRIVKYYNYMTNRELQLYFGYDDNTLRLIANKIRTLKNTVPYYSFDNLLNPQNKYHLLSPSSDNKIVIFSQYWSYSILSQCDTLFIDGTFKFKVLPYVQSFIVTAGLGNNTFTIMIALLPDKTKETYRDLFNRINNDGKRIIGEDFKFFERHLNIVSDFEHSFNFLSVEHPMWNHIGCSFHFKRDNMKYLFALGLPKTKPIDNCNVDISKQKITKGKKKFIKNFKSKIDEVIEKELKIRENEFKEMIPKDDSNIPTKNEDIKLLEIKEFEEFDNYEDNYVSQISKNNLFLQDVQLYCQSVQESQSINYQNKLEMLTIVEKYFKDDNKIIIPSSSMNSRILIKCLHNTCYLNPSFLNNNLFCFFFNEIKSKIKKDYIHIIEQYEQYFMKNWSINRIGYINFNIFNTNFTTNNISESTNSKLNWQIYDASSISLPKFIYKCKIVFVEQQQKIEAYNNGTLHIQQSDHTLSKRILIVILNIELFNNSIDLLSYLETINKINKITNCNMRNNCFSYIFEMSNSKNCKIRLLYLLSKNWSLNEDFQKEKTSFFEWIKIEIQKKTYVGNIVGMIYDIENNGMILNKIKSKALLERLIINDDIVKPKQRKNKLLKDTSKCVTQKEIKENEKLLGINLFNKYDQIQQLKHMKSENIITSLNNSEREINTNNLEENHDEQTTIIVDEPKKSNQIELGENVTISGIIYHSDSIIGKSKESNVTRIDKEDMPTKQKTDYSKYTRDMLIERITNMERRLEEYEQKQKEIDEMKHKITKIENQNDTIIYILENIAKEKKEGKEEK